MFCFENPTQVPDTGFPVNEEGVVEKEMQCMLDAVVTLPSEDKNDGCIPNNNSYDENFGNTWTNTDGNSDEDAFDTVDDIEDVEAAGSN